MVAGHLREKRGYYHIVLSYTDENGKRQTPSKSTGLPVKGNKKRAEAMLQEARRTMEAELQLRQMEREKGYTDNPADILFTRFLLDWLEMMKAAWKSPLMRLIHPVSRIGLSLILRNTIQGFG